MWPARESVAQSEKSRLLKIHSRIDKNENLGRGPKNFRKNLPAEISRAEVRRWERWAEKNLTDDEEAPSVEEVRELRSYQRAKAPWVFKRNERSEPILPDDVMEMKPADMKHIVQSFVGEHYRKSMQINWISN